MSHFSLAVELEPKIVVIPSSFTTPMRGKPTVPAICIEGAILGLLINTAVKIREDDVIFDDQC